MSTTPKRPDRKVRKRAVKGQQTRQARASPAEEESPAAPATLASGDAETRRLMVEHPQRLLRDLTLGFAMNAVRLASEVARADAQSDATAKRKSAEAATAAARILGATWIALRRIAAAVRKDEGDLETLRALQEIERAAYNWTAALTLDAEERAMIKGLPPRAYLDRPDAMRELLKVASDKRLADRTDAQLAEVLFGLVHRGFPHLDPSFERGDEIRAALTSAIADARANLGPRQLPRRLVKEALLAFGVSESDVKTWLDGIRE